jgi:RNA polymerase sigma factor (sigma-70 family)
MKETGAAITFQELTTTAVVERCLNGDASAWTELVRRYARLVHAVPVRHGLSPGEVDEVGQEVFLALAQHLHTIDDPERLPGWLVTTARRICWRMLQRRRYEQPLEEMVDGDERVGGAELPSPLPTPDELLVSWGRQEALSAAMTQLDARCRELLMLIFLDPEEPSYDAIGLQLNMPKGSIGPTRIRCLQRLRRILEDAGVRDAS